jgi:DNA-binding Lrp family transcriptional regulator
MLYFYQIILIGVIKILKKDVRQKKLMAYVLNKDPEFRVHMSKIGDILNVSQSTVSNAIKDVTYQKTIYDLTISINLEQVTYGYNFHNVTYF